MGHPWEVPRVSIERRRGSLLRTSLRWHASKAGMLLRSRPDWNAVLVSVVPLRRRRGTLGRPLAGRRFGPESK